ncbi:MAG TPA: carboxypeptidase-like regulatory domain-containing protein, partial [Candidatus Thermoplasmatota archaeon]|nr:carboxypeptidase-like regulatory domain-containing protein [Candidatus Thermoplasmatota archaeon]
MRLLAALAVLALTLAGCSDGKGDDDGATPQAGDDAIPMLHGYIFDAAIRPLEGATVKVLDTNSTAVTDADGFFGFDDLPVEQFLVVVASLDGFVPGSKQVTLTADAPVRLNFTLEAVPVRTPYMQVDKHDLVVECQVGTVANGENSTFACGAGASEGEDYWDIAVAPDLAGAVVEVYWEPTTDAAASIGARLETLELGQLNLILSEVVGTSPLRLSVPQLAAERYYASGGLMRLTVFAAPNADETEAGIGASV